MFVCIHTMEGLDKGYLPGSASLDLTVELVLEAPCEDTYAKPLRLPLDASSNEVVWLGPVKSVMCRAGVQELRGALGRDGGRQPGLGASGGDLWDGNSTGAIVMAGMGTASPDGLSGNITGQG